MKLYLISQSQNDGYDTYDSAVVVAKDAEAAKRISPSPYYIWAEDEGWHFQYASGKITKEEHNSWANDLNCVVVEYLGEAAPHMIEGTVICASFNAG